MSSSVFSLRAPLIDHIWPAKSLTRDVFLVVGISFLIAISAQIVFRLPFSPVPITSQTLVVLLAGAILGSRRGVLSVLVYLVEGAIGLPFFAKGGAGIAHLTGVTAGYLAGFVFATFFVGMLVEAGWGRKIHATITAMLIGNVIIYTWGVAWLQQFLHVSLPKAVALGLWPFIPGDLYKIGLAAILLPGLWRFFGTSREY